MSASEVPSPPPQTFTKEEVNAKLVEIDTNRARCVCQFPKPAVKECPVHGDKIRFVDMYLKKNPVPSLNEHMRLAQLAYAVEFTHAWLEITNIINARHPSNNLPEFAASLLDLMPRIDALLRGVGYAPVACALEELVPLSEVKLPAGAIVKFVPVEGLTPEQMEETVQKSLAAFKEEMQKKTKTTTTTAKK